MKPLAPAAGVARQAGEHHLLRALPARQRHPMRVMKRMRLAWPEKPPRHPGQGGEDVQRRRKRLRQEEIVEEIERIGQHRRPA